MAQPEPKHLKTRALICLLLLACDDDARPISALDHGVVDVGRTDIGRDVGRPSDAAPRDAEADARRLDARPPVDAVVRDAHSPDARPPVDADVRDASVADARPPMDATRPDARPVDAQPRDAGPVDAAVDAGPPDACVGIVLPPPPESPDGSEVCNYRDDDGDGLVDEGFPYDFLGEPVRINQEPEGVDELYLRWSGDGFGVFWSEVRGFRFIKLDTRGCPVSITQTSDPNPGGVAFPDSGGLAFAAQRFAALLSHERPPINGRHQGFGTYLQLYDLDGQPVGQPIDIDPTLLHLGKNAILAWGDHFAVFSGTFDPETGGITYGTFVIFDRDGRPVMGPSHPFNPPLDEGMSLGTAIGMDWDGEGFGFVWLGAGNWFMRWSPEGVVLTEPAAPNGIGNFNHRPGIAWNGTYYVVPNNGLDGQTVRLAFIAPDGSSPPWSPAVLSGGRYPSITYGIQRMGAGMLHHGAYADRQDRVGLWFSLLDDAGVPTSPALRDTVEIRAFVTIPGAPVFGVFVPLRSTDVFLTAIGCRQ